VGRRTKPGPAIGRGNATITQDGCPVEVYSALPPAGEAEIVHDALPAAAAVLELGCGTGRIAEPLAALGHRVVGVDSSAEMLAQLRRAEPVRSTIENLDLSQRFGGVLLASSLVNTPDSRQRTAFLDTARRHLDLGGTVVLQRHAPSWAAEAAATTWQAGPVQLELRDVVRHGDGLISATVVHRLGTLVAEQDFTSQVLDDISLAAVLAEAGLELGEVLTADQRWVSGRLRTAS